MKVILAGIGGWGRIWLDAVVQSPGVEFAALVEVDEAVIREQVARLDFDPGQVYADLADALAAVHSDGVILVTPPALHHQMSICALKAGKSVRAINWKSSVRRLNRVTSHQLPARTI